MRCEENMRTVEIEMLYSSREPNNAIGVGSEMHTGFMEASGSGCVNEGMGGDIDDSQVQMGCSEEESPQTSVSHVVSPDVAEAETPIMRGRPRRTLHKPKFLSEYNLG